MPHIFGNNCSTTLSQAITNLATTIYVAAGTGEDFPDLVNDDFMMLTLEDANGNWEIVKCTSRTGDTFIVERGQENEPAKAYDAGDRFELRLTAGAMNEFVQRQDDIVDGGTF